MKTHFKRTLASLLLASMLIVLPVQSAMADDVEEGDHGVEAANSDAFKWASPYNHGLRLTLWDVKSCNATKTVNIMTDNITGKVHWLGSNNKAEFSGASLGGHKSYKVDSNQPDLGGSGQKEWLLDKLHIQDFVCPALGCSPEDIYSGKYDVIVEPLVEVYFGSTAYTVVGTATELADYSLQLQGMGVSSSTIEKNLGNVISGKAPKHYYVANDHPDKHITAPNGAGEWGSGWVHPDAIVDYGWGVGILSSKTLGGTGIPGPVTPEQPTTKTIKANELNRPMSQIGTASASTIGNCSCSDDADWDLVGTVTNAIKPVENPTSGSGFDASTVNSLIGSRHFTAGRNSNLKLSAYMQTSNPDPQSIGFLGAPIYSRSSSRADSNSSVSSMLKNFIFQVTGCRKTKGKTTADGKKTPDKHREIHATQNRTQPPLVYNAEPTKFESSKTYRVQTPEPAITSDNSQQREVIELTNSKTFNFYPTYKMDYYSEPTNMNSKHQTWMLATGKRSLKFTPFIAVVAQDNFEATAPWSRDIEDTSTGMQTLKAGNAVKGNGVVRYTVTLQYFEQDPYFLGNGSTDFDLRYQDEFDHIVNELTDNMYLYSNAPYTGSSEMNILGVPTQKISNGYVLRKSYRTGSFVGDSDIVSDKLLVQRSNGYVSGKNSKTGTTVEGKSPSLSSNILGSLLTASGWYKEDYEGIIKVTRTAVIEVRSIDNEYVELYRELSDVLDKEAIQNTKPILNKPSNIPVYNKRNFVIGYGTIIEPYGVIPEIRIHGKFEEFQIRGSAYELR